ncbi:MAG: glycosyltransferase family 2 protein [Desulfobacterales bacterium]
MAFAGNRITAIIPALNEEQSLGLVLKELPDFVDRVIVCDNGSSDKTAETARAGGATVVNEPEKGYGAACLKAIEEVDDNSDILLFIDADYSDYPREADKIIQPIVESGYDMVIGSRMLTLKEHSALPLVAAFGNWLTSKLIRLLWKVKFTDMGPFRAIRFSSYRTLNMKDRNFGWTTEMQVKAAKRGLKCCEVPVSYRTRIGKSKVSGTFYGSFRAGTKFLWIIFREAIRP